MILQMLNYESLAQLAEHLTFNQGVRGSNPRWFTITELRRAYKIFYRHAAIL